MTDYDAIVIGAGQAGPNVAAALAQQGKRTVLVEMAELGGTCLNHGCKPTKALRASAVVAHQARRAARYGVSTGEVSVDLGAALDRVHRMIDDMRQSLRDWLDSVDSLDVVPGTARLTTDPSGRHRVTVGEQTLVAPEVYLNVGARAVVPPMEGIEDVDYLTEVELLQLTELPQHLLVVGGGYVGCEFGQMFRRFGSAVTMVVSGRVLPREDSDVAQLVSDMLTEEGIQVLAARVTKVARGGDGVIATLDNGSTLTASHLLLAVGRQPNLDFLGENHGLAVDERGYLETDTRYATSVPGVWALGDVNGYGAFTHTAYQDGQILLSPERSVQGRVMTYAVFTDPPLGRVGMTVDEARASGRRVLSTEVSMAAVSRAILDGETTGLLRILVDGDTEEFLGATILGLHADDLVQIIGLALQAGVRYPAIRDALPIHPTMAEFLPFALQSLRPLDDPG